MTLSGRRIFERAVDLAGAALALSLMAGFVPIVISAWVAKLLGHRDLAEGILWLGLIAWIAIRSLVGWRMSVAWRRSEAQRIAEGRPSAGDIRREEDWAARKARRRQYMREVMLKRAAGIKDAPPPSD
jgi:hypothetical protein